MEGEGGEGNSITGDQKSQKKKKEMFPLSPASYPQNIPGNLPEYSEDDATLPHFLMESLNLFPSLITTYDHFGTANAKENNQPSSNRKTFLNSFFVFTFNAGNFMKCYYFLNFYFISFSCTNQTKY